MNIVFAFVFMLFAAFPFAVLAQSPDGASFTLPTSTAGVISLLVQTLVIPLIGLLGQALWGWIEKRKGRDALGRIFELIDAVGQPIWDRMEPKVRFALADGVVDATERAALLVDVKMELERLVSPAVIKLAMKALGVPDVLGLASWLLGKLLARWKGAHDAGDPSVPNAMTGVYPVFVERGVSRVSPDGIAPDASEGGRG